MGQTNRFFNIPYVLNSLKIKLKTLTLRATKGPYPYETIQKQIQVIHDADYHLLYDEVYHALDYFDVEQAQRYHSGTKSITQEIIVGLVYSNAYFKGDHSCKQTIIDTAKNVFSKGSQEGDELVFYIDEDYEKFDLIGRYLSGIVQGKAASLFIRCFEITKNQSYLKWAKQALNAAFRPIHDNGPLIHIPHDLIWVEEYPSPKPSMVLNGFLFYIIGLVEYLNHDPDKPLMNKMQLCMQSVLSWMPHYVQKNGLLYSLYRWNLCNVHYTGIMTFQFEHLFRLTKMEEFQKMAKFTRSITNWRTFDKLIGK